MSRGAEGRATRAVVVGVVVGAVAMPGAGGAGAAAAAAGVGFVIAGFESLASGAPTTAAGDVAVDAALDGGGAEETSGGDADDSSEGGGTGEVGIAGGAVTMAPVPFAFPDAAFAASTCSRRDFDVSGVVAGIRESAAGVPARPVAASEWPAAGAETDGAFTGSSGYSGRCEIGDVADSGFAPSTPGGMRVSSGTTCQ